MSLGQSESIGIKFTEKFFLTQFCSASFLKFYGNKLAFIIYTKLEQNVNDNDNHNLYMVMLTISL